jgi:hypothetical protein
MRMPISRVFCAALGLEHINYNGIAELLAMAVLKRIKSGCSDSPGRAEGRFCGNAPASMVIDVPIPRPSQ